MDTTLEALDIKRYQLRGVEVVLDQDLATLFEVELEDLIAGVWQNKERFPTDFMFRVEDKEFAEMQLQGMLVHRDQHDLLPFVFTEKGFLMLPGVLESEKAIQLHIQIMREFIKTCQVFYNN
jgi:ORF6N domain-containing protein